MADDLLKYQCPACTAPLHFDPEKQMLVCDSCDSTFPQEFFTQPAAPDGAQQGIPPADGTAPVQNVEQVDWRGASRSEQGELPTQTGYECTSCGAQVMSDGATLATECVYCGNPVVVAINVTGALTPDFVVPFKIEKQQAQQMLLEFYNGKPLLPNTFKDANRVAKITGMYVPFWLFSCTGDGHVNFKAEKVHRWSDSSYNYTRTEYFDVIRAGNIAFDHVPVDASKKMDDNYMDGLEPYSYDGLVPFSPMYMAGYFADKFDVSVDESTPRASSRVITSVKEALKGTVSGYSSVREQHSNINMMGENIHYALFPVWMLNTKYDDKMYQFAINGQTGRVSGELPIDKTKLLLWRLFLTLGTALPVFFLTLWLLS